MLKILLLSLCILASTVASYAQVYIKPKVSYHMGFGGSTYESQDQNYVVARDLSFGGGMGYGADIVLDLSQIFSLEVGITRIKGGRTELENDIYEYSSKYFLTHLSFVAQTKDKLINPYIKMGPAFVNAEVEMKVLLASNNAKASYLYSGGWSLGFQTGAGIYLDINDRIRFNVGLQLVQIDHSPRYGEITEYKQNNKDLLPQLTKSERMTIYTKKLLSNYVPNEHLPTKSLKFNMPFDNASAVMSVSIKLF